MTCLLDYNIDSIGIVFICIENDQQLPVEVWGRQEIYLLSGKKARVGILNLLFENECVTESDDGLNLFVPHDVLAKLDSWEVEGLGLPSFAPFRLVVKTHGTLANESFRVEYGFTYHDGLPVSFKQRIGAVLFCSNEKYLLPDPLFSVIKLFDEYQAHPITDMDQRFLWWGKVRELLPEDTKIGKFLQTINIVKPENFTIDFSEKNGDFIITPRFVMPLDSDNENKEVLEHEEPQNIIPPAVHEDFVSSFLKQSSVKTRYALPERWFIVLPKTLHIALEVVREIKNAPIERKLAFLHNPRGELRNKLENFLDEEILEKLFIETPLFLNKRIKHLGVWQPKHGLFIKTESGQWLPENGPPSIVGIPINGGIYSIPTKDLQELYESMESSLVKGLQHLEFGKLIFPINRNSVDIVKKAVQVFMPEKPTKKGDTEDPSDKIEKPVGSLVPIIYDHIEELGICVDETGKRAYVHEVQPKLANGIHLHDHQKSGLTWLQNHWKNASPGALLADDMGLGKTLQTLIFMSWVKLQMENGCIPKRPFLLVAPTALLKNWEAELQKFLPPPGLGHIMKAHGSAFKFLADQGWSSASSALKESDWILTTYETLRDKIMAFTSIHWAVIVFDEAQKIKNPNAMVTDMAKSLKAEFTISLTGTPVENSLADLWCIIDAVWPGKLGTLKEFSKKYIPDGKAGRTELMALKEELSSNDQPLMLRRSKDEHWKERPPKFEKIHKTQMPEDQAMAYSAAVERARCSLGQKGAMLKAIQSLRVISLHPFLGNVPDNHESFINSSARLKATFSILDDLYKSKNKVLIFVEYLTIQSTISEIIQRRYGCRNIMIINGQVSGKKRQARVDDFQKEQDGFDVMILSPKAGGIGLNITAATHVIHLSRWWNPAVEDQCSDRAYRIGQTKSVTIHYPLAIHPHYGLEQSFDAKLHDLLEKKRFLSRTLLAPPAGTSEDVNWLFEQSVGSKNGFSDNLRESAEKKQESEEFVDLERIDLMEPIEFERWVLSRLEAKGYEIRSTPVSGDAGSDGIAIAPSGTNYLSFIVQCKHTQRNKNMGHYAVEEILNSLSRYKSLPDLIQPMVVTNAKGFTINATTMARNRNVKLISRSNLKFLYTLNS